MKWCAVGYNIDFGRYKVLDKFLNDQGIKSNFEVVEVSPSSFPEKLIELTENFDQIRIDSPFRHTSFGVTHKNEAEMLLLRSADCYFQDDSGSWWLRSAIFHGMEAIINRMKGGIDYEGAALIVGAGGAARAAISALVKTGMQNFNITNSYDDQVLDLIDSLKKIYFNIHFHFVSQGQLVLLPGTNSIVVNTTPYRESNEIVRELSYFNFLKSPGLIWELSTNPIETELVTEAEQIGASVIRGHEFATETDRAWLGWVLGERCRDLAFGALKKQLLRRGIFKEESP